MKLPYYPVGPLVGRSICYSVGRSVTGVSLQTSLPDHLFVSESDFDCGDYLAAEIRRPLRYRKALGDDRQTDKWTDRNRVREREKFIYR